VARLVAAEALELALLQNAQQLDLHRRRHVADLVQENGAGVGLLELARLGAVCARERALFVAEQLASIRFSGMAVQLILTKGLSRRGEW